MMVPLFAFLCLLSAISSGHTRSVGSADEPIVTIVTGTFYAIESRTGQNEQRINRRHLNALDTSQVQAMRLDLGAELGTLDMELTQDSAWTRDSKVTVVHGDHVEEHQSMAFDSNCFLSGSLKSKAGAVSLNTCGGLSGSIHTGEFHYDIEGLEDYDLDSDLSNVKITVRRSRYATPVVEDFVIKRDLHDTEDEVAVAEVAVYLDENYINYISRSRHNGMATNDHLTKWVISKWSIIRFIFGIEREIGFAFDVQLKKVELWRSNPSYYAALGNKSATEDYLSTMCTNTTNQPAFDHKMLYTVGTGDAATTSVTTLGGICKSDQHQNCALVKNTFNFIRKELHVFGNNLGVPNESEIKRCRETKEFGGFMAPNAPTQNFFDCYRPIFQSKVDNASCLLKENVPSMSAINNDHML